MVDTTIIDFTNCQIDTSAQYGGSDQKRGIFYKDKRYMLKMPDRIDEVKRNQWNSSYSNSVYSEKVCCDILKALGFSVQNVLFGFIIVNNNKSQLLPVKILYLWVQHCCHSRQLQILCCQKNWARFLRLPKYILFLSSHHRISQENQVQQHYRNIGICLFLMHC